MGDEKTPAQPGTKKTDKPPAPAPQPAPKDQHAGPAKAAVQKQPTGGGQQATPAGQTAALQKSVGNQQVNRLMRAAREPDKDPRAPGVKVSHPDDAHEKEAEAVAKHVTSGEPAHSHGKSAYSGAAPGDPPKVVGDPEVAHRAVAPRTASAQQHPGPDHHAAQHPAAHTAAAQHPAPAGPNPASVLDHPGPGQPIPQPTRGVLEAKLKADLSHVVVHQDAAADQAVRALHARAVTKGDHIFLAGDASPNDLSLMAHEVTHVLHHQGGVAHRQTAGPTAAPASPANAPSGKYYEGKEGTVDIVPSKDGDNETKKTVEIAEVRYADAKQQHSGVDVHAKFAAGTRIVPALGRGETEQEKKWPKGIDKAATTKAIEDLLPDTTTIPAPEPGEDPATGRGALYLLRFGAGGPSTGSSNAKTLNGVIVGTKDGLIATAILPYWDRHRKFNPMNVDHLVEIQVGGPDTFDNYWLWEAVANQSGGGQLAVAINEHVRNLLAAAKEKHKDDTGAPPLPADRNSLGPSEWRIKVGKLGTGLGPLRGSPDVHWTAGEVNSAEPAKLLSKVTVAEARALGMDPGGSANHLTIVVGSKGRGALVRVPWKPNQKEATGADAATAFSEVYPHFKATKVAFDQAAGKGEVVGDVSNKDDLTKTKTIDLALTGFPGKKTSGLPFAQLSGQVLAQKVGFFHFEKLSPIRISEAEMVPYTGFTARGVLQPSIPILRDNPVDVVFSGGDLWLEKTFDAKNLQAPAPLKITGGGITISAGTNGFRVGGTLSAALGTVATASISASIDSTLNFALDGSIDFDKTLFQPAKLDFFYHKTGSTHDWGIGGTLGIPPKKVPGIDKGTITASYGNGRFAASGDATLSVPGLQSGSLTITYSEQEGIAIGGKFALAPNPVVESGSVDATVTKRPPGNHWALSAHGTVKPKIPGVDTTLSAVYEDGVFTVEGSVAYARGMLSGSLTVGLTNRPLGPDGRPAAAASEASAPTAGAPKAGAPHASGPLRPYGGGTLTAKIAPWLQGTVGVQLQQDGSVQLTGEIKLPDSINLFDPVEVQKNLLTIGVDIPIVGVSVAGQRIGIFATIQGGLDVSAGIGPGQLKQLGLKVQYNPEHEDQTQITGTAQLAVPAHAGLRLYVRGGLGAGIPVVSAEAGLEIGGRLGVEGAVEAGVTVNWTPKQGLTIDAQAKLSAEPSFTFDVNGYVKVSADLLFTTVDLYEKHWQLASFRYGSGLRVGVTAPIHYEQGKPFSFSPSDVQFELPKIDPTHILTDLVHQIA